MINNKTSNADKDTEVFFFKNVISGDHKADAMVVWVLGSNLQSQLAACGRRSPCEPCRVDQTKGGRACVKGPCGDSSCLTYRQQGSHTGLHKEQEGKEQPGRG